MTITYRDTKGSNLTPAEVDANFRDVVAQIAAAVAGAAAPNGISNIVVSGTQMTIYLDDATALGPFTLPRAPFRPTITLTETTAARTLDLTDANGYIRCTNAAGCVVTIPSDAEVAFASDVEISFRQCDAGQVSFDVPTAVTLNGVAGYLNETAFEGAVVTLKKVAADEWDVFGLLAEDITS